MGNLKYARNRVRVSGVRKRSGEEEGEKVEEEKEKKKCRVSVVTPPSKCMVLIHPRNRAKGIQDKNMTERHLIVSVPDPYYGSEYTPKEVYSLLATAAGPTERGRMVAQLLERRLVPCGRANLYKLLKKWGKDGPPTDNEWNRRGWPPILNTMEVKQVCEEHFSNHGRTLTERDLVDALKSMRKSAAKKGVSTAIVASANKATVKNYLTYVGT